MSSLAVDRSLASFPPILDFSKAESYEPHRLHAADRHWPLTNCYVDLLVELLHEQGLQPEAALPFTLLQDFEGDQFSFFKFPVEDLEVLYGLAIQELAIFDTLESHCLEQTRRGNVVLVEVDSWFLPDTRGLAYQTEHTKTTIGVRSLDPTRRTLDYFHNAGFYRLEGEDYASIFVSDQPDTLFPYAEFICRRGQPLSDQALLEASLARLAIHRRRRPAGNPMATYRKAFPAHIEKLIGRSNTFFHRYAFNTVRQLGANFEMLASYAAWLDEAGVDGLQPAIEPALVIAQQAKILQFRLARIAARRRGDPCIETFDRMEAAYDQLMNAIDRSPL